MTQAIRKAVFPVAGLGTRFLPATQAAPKQVLPVVDKPLIQYEGSARTAAARKASWKPQWSWLCRTRRWAVRSASTSKA